MGSLIPAGPPAVIPGLIGLLALAVAVALWLHWRDRPDEPSAAPPAATSDYDARPQLAGLPVKGWDRMTDF